MTSSVIDRTVRVQVSPAYDVRVAAGLLSEVPRLVDHDSVALIVDANVRRIYGHDLVSALEGAGMQVTQVTVSPGEPSKDLATYGRVLRELAGAGLDRGSAVIALGGGVVGDLAGFVAATYLRGVALYQVPTTLLAMVDSSVGGKTGVDLLEGKNLVGAYWQPRAVFTDVKTLDTLPPQELRQGAAELLKTGLIGDPALTDVAAESLVPAVAGEGPLPPAEALVDAVSRSVRVKAGIVAADEREGGVRAHLNLGHTLGHALEAASRYALPHGDAVLYGLLFAALLGRERGMVDVVERLTTAVKSLRPEPLPAVGFSDLTPFMARDKKSVAGRPRFVLLAQVGEPVVVSDVGAEEMGAAWRELVELAISRS